MTKKELKERIEEMSYDEHKAFETYCELHDLEEDDEESINRFENAYKGKYDSEEDFIQELMDDEDVPHWLQCCVDMEKAVREVFNFDYDFSNGYVFYQE